MPTERFELPTNGLQNRCSTTELSRHGVGALEGGKRETELYRTRQGSLGVPATVFGGTRAPGGARSAGIDCGAAAG